jgi:hypothetical protein
VIEVAVEVVAVELVAIEIAVEVAAEVVAVEIAIEVVAEVVAVVVAMMMMMMMKNTILNSNYKFPFDNSQFDFHISSTILLDFYSRVCLYLFQIIYVLLRLILIFQYLEVELVSR